MIKNRALIPLAFILATGIVPVQASLTAVQGTLPEPQLVGEARLKMMFWNIFDAKLFSQSGQFSPEKPFALSLTYLRSFEDNDIVDRSIDEIQSQKPEIAKNTLAQWKRQLSQIIPDVSKGSTITGVRTSEGYTRFFLNDNAIGEVKDDEFTLAFFDIWLGEKTSNLRLRNKLIGRSGNI